MKYILGIVVAAVLAVAGGGWFYLSQQGAVPPAAEEQEAVAPVTEQAAIPGTAAPEEPLTIERRFEKLLNGFLLAVNEKARAYKNERKVLGELVKPENLSSSEYITQNQQVMKQTIAALHLKIDDLMLVFEKTQGDVQALLTGEPPAVAEPILKTWSELKSEKAGLYVDFFSIEEKILQAYDDLMAFYVLKKGEFSYDAQTGQITFKNPEDEGTVIEMRTLLVDLAAQEEALLEQQVR